MMMVMMCILGIMSTVLAIINEIKSMKIPHCDTDCQQHRATSEEGILLLARCKRENPIGQFSFLLLLILRLHFILVAAARCFELSSDYQVSRHSFLFKGQKGGINKNTAVNASIECVKNHILSMISQPKP